MSGPLKRFVDSIRDLFSDPENNDPLDRMSDFEPRTEEDSVESEENVHPPVSG
jgi:hypothetical protein